MTLRANMDKQETNEIIRKESPPILGEKSVENIIGKGVKSLYMWRNM